MGRGDNFNKVSTRAEQLNPSADKWSDQVLYLLRSLTGSDLPANQQITVKIDGELPTVIAKINEAISKLNELKAELIDIDSNTDAIEASLTGINTSINNQGTNVITTLEVQAQAIIETFLDRLGESVKVEVVQAVNPTHDHILEIGSVNTDTVVVLVGEPELRHKVLSISYGYQGGLGEGLLTVTDDALDIFQLPIKLEGSNVINFEYPLYGSVGNDLTITLEAGGTGIIGYVNACVE